MGPAGKLINIRQGEGRIEEYAGRFWEVARRLATEKTCLLVFFWGGLAEPLRARMPYWNPEESLEGYLNLALRLSGSAFRVESAAEPVRDSSQAAASAPKAPEAAVPAHTAHEAPNAAVPAHTAPEAPDTTMPAHTASEAAVPAHTAHEVPSMARPAYTAPEAAVSAPTGEPTASAPEPAPFREPTESAPEPAPFREPTQSAPFREPTESAHKACEVAAVSAHGPPALPAPPWHPCLPLSPGPLPLHGPGLVLVLQPKWKTKNTKKINHSKPVKPVLLGTWKEWGLLVPKQKRQRAKHLHCQLVCLYSRNAVNVVQHLTFISQRTLQVSSYNFSHIRLS